MQVGLNHAGVEPNNIDTFTLCFFCEYSKATLQWTMRAFERHDHSTVDSVGLSIERQA